MAAQEGDVDALKREIARKKDLVNARDRNGWTVSDKQDMTNDPI